uniref:RRM domain-containing protein n=1 Tax=Entomoneis paludosa TaxID=265537 RepID=A0A7S3DR74_9STRA|mmetsp:Transcript_30395/g.63453  ORF Transcript_30395/g.63453 Transcript_30395/m.63453 type:complete len:376 (+) Transcript_30395:130-1257(+)
MTMISLFQILSALLLILAPFSSHGWVPSTTRTGLLRVPNSSNRNVCLQSSTHPDETAKPQFQQPQHAGKRPTKKIVVGNTGSKFAQPKFSQASRGGDLKKKTTNGNNSSLNPNHKKFNADSQIASRHVERLKMAGREGTKRYQNPNKVFLGNLNFTVTDQDLTQFLSQEFAMPSSLLLKQCKVVRDWKTQKSKGFAFAVFAEPIYATVCLEKMDKKEFRGRPLNVQPGYKAAPDPQIYIEQKRQKKLAREAAALLNVDSEEEEDERMDPMEAMMLRHLDPDLVDDDMVAEERKVVEFKVENQGQEEISDDDEFLFGSDDDDDDDSGIDGYWFDDDNDDSFTNDIDKDILSKMNRKERREAARKSKKKKASNKGFG